jgi:hypothetical protein
MVDAADNRLSFSSLIQPRPSSASLVAEVPELRPRSALSVPPVASQSADSGGDRNQVPPLRSPVPSVRGKAHRHPAPRVFRSHVVLDDWRSRNKLIFPRLALAAIFGQPRQHFQEIIRGFSIAACFAAPIVSLPPGCVPKVRLSPLSLLRSAITGKIGSPVTIRQTHQRSRRDLWPREFSQRRRLVSVSLVSTSSVSPQYTIDWNSVPMSDWLKHESLPHLIAAGSNGPYAAFFPSLITLAFAHLAL